MLNVFITVDVEIWCGDWKSIDARFPEAFRRYIYGPTARGDYGLPYKLRLLSDAGLTGVFFVEPLFTGRFGIEPLAEITGLISEKGQEIQLHLHTEWVDESIEPLLPDINSKRPHLRQFSLEEQNILIAKGLEMLHEAGSGNTNAFRAGSFGFNTDTLAAVRNNGISFDSSYNAIHMGLDSGLLPGTVICEPLLYKGIHEYPMTVYYDFPGHLRHTQLGACSFRELEGLLWRALEEERKAFVILSHNFELLDSDRTRPNNVVVERYRKLCHFLDQNRDSFRTSGFHGLAPDAVSAQPAPLRSAPWKTCLRMIEQTSPIYRT